MRRATVRALRTTYQYTSRSLAKGSVRRSSFLPAHVRSNSTNSTSSRLTTTSTGLNSTSRTRAASSRPRQDHVLGEPLAASMFVRRLSLAAVSGLVGFGAWYSYTGQNGTEVVTRSYKTAATPNGAALPTRNVLVITANELYTDTVVGEGPISKVTHDGSRMVVEMLSPDQSTERLRKSEESLLVNRGQGVVRYDLVQLPSNNPIEDDHAEKIVEVNLKAENGDPSQNDWMFWGVFDGHSGWTTSAKLRQALIGSVARELNETYSAAPGLSPSADAIEAAMKAGFVRLDDEIVNKSVEKVFKQNNKTVAAELLAPALSGSCALLSFYDSRSKLLRVACTGDSRAVLGKRSNSGKWTATPLSVDQTGANPDEAARMRKLHPGEEHVVRNGRVLGGLEPTRAFGDASYKWTREVSDRLRRSFFGRTPSQLLKTPPYVTAEPVVTTTSIEPEKGDFLVMATDGLWEMLTNEEVVGLVGKWIEHQQSTGATKGLPSGTGTSRSQFDSVWSKIFGSSGKAGDLPVEAASAGSAGGDGQKTPIRVQQWGLTPDGRERFVVRDQNVATHIVRNALGGKNEEQVSALLTLQAPHSRRYRDDLTVQVIFFGNGERTGEVVVNEEATAPQPAVKPKL